MAGRSKVGAGVVVAAVVAFALGWVGKGIQARGIEDELRADLAREKALTALGVATVEAQRGSFILAEQWAIHGFAELQDHLHEVPEVSRVVIEDVLMHRDGTIAELTRADPRGATSLADMFVRIQSLAGTKPTRRTLPPFPDPAARPSR